MKAIIQRVSKASVTVERQITGKIEHGLLVLLGVTHTDTKENAKMNLSVKDIKGEILVVSQFTLYADTSKRK